MDAPDSHTTPDAAISRHTTTPSAIILPTLAFLVCLLSIPPLITHITARNLAASVLVAGLVIVNLQNFVNALIWPSYPLDTRFDGRGLCDVEVKLYLGVGTATAGAMASIFRQLALALDTDKPTIVTSKSRRIRNLTFEIGLCLVLPAYTMAVHYIVQPKRYYLVAVTGCLVSFWEGWATHVLITMWPVIVGTVGAGYCILAMCRLVRHRRSMSSILSSSSTINTGRYVRLFILAIGLLVIFIPFVAYTLAYTVAYSEGHSPGPYSWSKIHPPEWSTTIIRLDAVTEKRRYHRPFDRWGQIATGFISFLLFGLGHEAVTMYKAWLVRVGFPRRPRTFNCPHSSVSAVSNGLSGLAELDTSHSSRAPIRDAIDMELERIDRDLELGSCEADESRNGSFKFHIDPNKR